jgi:hypothetical protein
MSYVIVSASSRADCRGTHVIDPRTGEILRFAERRAARTHRDAIRECTPSKYYPLVVREEADPQDTADA